MAMARLDVPSLALYNGTIYPGMYKGRTVDVVSVYEAIGQVLYWTLRIVFASDQRFSRP